jgi:hypothetical protein
MQVESSTQPTWYISFSFIEIELKPAMNSSNLHTKAYSCHHLQITTLKKEKNS